MIQAVISRLSSQSTTVKGWCITVTAGLLGFSATATSLLIALIAFYVVLSFAILDAYYLSLERAYRMLYQRAAVGDAEDWTLDIDRPGFRDVGVALGSPAVAVLYGTSTLTTLTIAAYLAFE